MTALTLRHMQTADVNAVVNIDRLSFDPPWPASSYHFEVNRSPCSYMVILEEEAPPIMPPPFTVALHRLWRGWFGWRNGSQPERRVAGYGGLWKIQEEAHISTIAVHPQSRGSGYGELLLVGMLRRAALMEAEYCVLEVRVSNNVAQRLYRKYRFEIHAVKDNYYRNNNEDAYDMRVMLTTGNRAFIQEQYEAVQRKHPFHDSYTRTPHPRLG